MVELQGELTLLEAVKLPVVTLVVVVLVLAATAVKWPSDLAVAGVGVTLVEGLLKLTGARAAVLSRAALSQHSLTRRA